MVAVFVSDQSAVTPGPAVPKTAAEAVAMAQAGLAWLAKAGVAGLPTSAQADCLRGLERAASMYTAAQATVLGTFTGQGGHEDDGHGSARTWLRWQTRISGGAADTAVGWMRRLAAHPAVHSALTDGQVSASFARAICAWTDKLREHLRADADAILLAAAAGGADLADLARLAEEMRQRTAAPDTDGSDGFDDRWLRLDETFRGAGSISGDLTPQCRAALAAVLEALGKKAGPEDTRSKAQRDHDAVHEACRRLLGSACLPDRAGQPTQIQLHMTLDKLRDQGDDSAEAAESAGSAEAARSAEGAWADSHAGTAWAAGTCGRPAAGPGDDCDASIVPIVTGHVDHDLLDRLAAALADGKALVAADRAAGPRALARRQRAQSAARRLLLRWAADVLSGPDGLAAYLRTRQPERLAASASLPLDIGAATDSIPGHLRRAAAARDRHCRYPGCRQPVMACQVHHIVPRSEGGPTKLTNLLNLCSFHHLIAIHRWGWGITLHPDGSVTATSPDGTRVLHDHGPPPATAA